jgi:hypothetical protein
MEQAKLSLEQKKRRNVATVAANRCLAMLAKSPEMLEIISAMEESDGQTMTTLLRIEIERVLEQYHVHIK